ncbi:hypothetical protein GLA29479_4747 [Lysobacter antibioticus]|nr:hypothetical protein GLA29479_4747 [Lysobacter antibioticus]
MLGRKAEPRRIAAHGAAGHDGARPDTLRPLHAIPTLLESVLLESQATSPLRNGRCDTACTPSSSGQG